MNKEEIKEEIIDKIVEMAKEIKKLKEELNKLEKPSRKWKPEFHDKYYYIDSAGVVNVGYWDDCNVDKIRYALGNVFKTREEARFAIEQLKVLADIREYADNKEWNGNNEHKCIIYDTSQKCFDIGNYICNINTPFNLYFSSEEQAQKAINAIGEERLKKYYFCVDE